MVPSDLDPENAADEAVQVFAAHRRRLFGIAYRMLGSAAEAEDVVQDAWLRWHAAERTAVLDAEAFLVTLTTRLAINVAQSARVRRESYVGPWLPEPVDTSSDPEAGVERNQTLALAVLVLLEKLTPTERAAYVLREAFDYSHERIAEVLQLREDNVRQLVTRARKHIADGRRAPVSPSEQRRLLEAFVTAARQGDSGALERILTADVVTRSDGGGVVRLAARSAIAGRERVARFVASFPASFWDDAELSWREMNGQAAVVLSRHGHPVMFATIDASADGIDQVFWILSPAKLRSV
jgi:RNA polymerase sigma-70 factor (TIGR02957 family)